MSNENYIVENMPMLDYHAIDALSNSGLGELAQCPARYYAMKLDPNRPEEVEKEGHLHGNLAHCAFLEPVEFGKRYVVLPDDAPKKPTSAQWNAKKPSDDSVAAMAWWKEFGERHTGKRIITQEQAKTAFTQAANLMALPKVWRGFHMNELLERSPKAEVSAFWNDPMTGVACRCRPDMVIQINDRQCILLDVKTYSSSERGEVVRQIARKGYFRQAAHYSIGYHLASGLEVVAFIFVFVESTYPYLAGSYTLSEEFMQHGMAEQRALVDLYAECKRTGVWPSYTKQTETLDIPAYLIGSQQVEVGYAD